MEVNKKNYQTQMKNMLKRRKDQERDKVALQEQVNALDLEVKGAQEELHKKKEVAKSADFGLFKNKLAQNLKPKEDVPAVLSLDLDKE